MVDRNKANATNDEIDLQADNITDLQISDQQAEETKGGTGTHGVGGGQGAGKVQMQDFHFVTKVAK